MTTDAENPADIEIAAVMTLEGEGLRSAVAREVMGWDLVPLAWKGAFIGEIWALERDECEPITRDWEDDNLAWCDSSTTADEAWAKLSPLYEASHDLSAEVMVEIEKRGLLDATGFFICALREANGSADWVSGLLSQYLSGAWVYGFVDVQGILTASPADKCRAALLAVRGAERNPRR